MARYKLIIEYDGGPFVGWQRQDNGLSVQAVLEDAASRFCGAEVPFFAAGRTDAGVHALGQAAHTDFPGRPDGDTVRDAINYHLGDYPVAVLSAEPVDDDFDARFSALRRVYRYRIINRRASLAMDAGRAWRVPVALNAEAMQSAAAVLTGHHDFTSFRSTQCQAKSPLKTLDSLDVTRDGNEIRIEARARSFMHNQVRIMAGTLKLAGEGKWNTDDVQGALAARDRAAAGPTAPPQGLYLIEVSY